MHETDVTPEELDEYEAKLETMSNPEAEADGLLVAQTNGAGEIIGYNTPEPMRLAMLNRWEANRRDPVDLVCDIVGEMVEHEANH